MFKLAHDDDSSKVTTPSPSLSACCMIVSALRATSASLSHVAPAGRQLALARMDASS